MSLEDRIGASRLGYGPLDWDLCLKTRIMALRPGYELQRGWTEEKKEKKKEKKEKFPLCVKA